MPATLLQATLSEVISGNLFFTGLYLVSLIIAIYQLTKKGTISELKENVPFLTLVAVTGLLAYVMAQFPTAMIFLPLQLAFIGFTGVITGVALVKLAEWFGIEI